MQRHAHQITAARRVRTLMGSFAVLLIGTAFYSQNVRAQTTPSGNIPATASYSCDFENTYCDFNEQSKLEPTGGQRSTLVAAAASGTRGVKLTTLVGDNNIHGSGTWERNDLSKGPDASYCNAGQEEWWAFSIMFPDDYVFPPGPEAGIIMDFHHNASSGQANYEIQTIPGIGLRARGYGGGAINTGKYDALIPDPYGATANVTKNQWYHFVLHVRWSPNGDGLMEGWLNGKKYQSYQGATLYSGISCYLKLANYHGAFGQASSLIHDRIARGATAADVTLMALEGVAGTGTAPTTPPPPTAYALSTVTMGSGTGTVTSSPSGINCGSSCSTTFAPGAAVTLSASPASGSTFSGWSGACSGTGGCTVTMSTAKSVTATFAANVPQSNPTPSGSGVGVSASTLYFKSGVQSSQTLTYTNNTASTVQFIQASMSSGKYQQTNNCDAVAPGKSCSTVTYYTTNSGSETATFTVTSNAPNSPHVVTLTTAAAPAPSGVTLSASTLAFGATSSTQTVTFTNNTAKTVQFIRASMSSGKYQQTNNCDAVAPGASCQAKVTYYPSNSGSTSATLTVTSDAPNSPNVITLTASASKPRVVA